MKKVIPNQYSIIFQNKIVELVPINNQPDFSESDMKNKRDQLALSGDDKILDCGYAFLEEEIYD